MMNHLRCFFLLSSIVQNVSFVHRMIYNLVGECIHAPADFFTFRRYCWVLLLIKIRMNSGVTSIWVDFSIFTEDISQWSWRSLMRNFKLYHRRRDLDQWMHELYFCFFRRLNRFVFMNYVKSQGIGSLYLKQGKVMCSQCSQAYSLVVALQPGNLVSC